MRTRRGGVLLLIILASCGGASATSSPPFVASTTPITASAISVTSAAGNGDPTVECVKSKPVEKGDCTYVYPTSSAKAPNVTFPARVLVEWAFLGARPTVDRACSPQPRSSPMSD